MTDNSNDALDHLCATDPTWKGALQLLQLAKRQASADSTGAVAQLLCALVLFASEETQDPQAFLEECARGLRDTPLKKDRQG